MSTLVPVWMVRLLSWTRLGAMRLGPEDRLAIEVAEHLRAWTLEGRLNAVWTHLANEVAGGAQGAARRYALAKAMGLITGAPDYVFTWPGGSGWIELKSRTGRPSAPQLDFSQWCASTHTPYAVCRSIDDVRTTLESWGALGRQTGRADPPHATPADAIS